MVFRFGSTVSGSIALSGQRRGFLFGRPALNCVAGSNPATATGESCIKTQLVAASGEHGNIRYAPRGLREQPDRLLVFILA